MKERTSKIRLLLNPLDLMEILKRRVEAYNIKYSYLLGRTRMPPPKALVFVINQNCNARCIMCDVGTKNTQTHIYKLMSDVGERFLPIADFKKIIDSVRYYKPDIWFMATEPLLYPYLFEAAAYVKKMGMSFQLTTNGIRLAEFAQKIVEEQIDRVLVSVSAGDPELHDKITGIPGAFSKIMAGLELLQKAKKSIGSEKTSVSLNLVVSNHNYHKLYNHVKTLTLLDIDKLTVAHTQFVSKEMAQKHKDLFSQDPVTESSVFHFNPTDIDTAALFDQISMIRRDFARLNLAFVPDIKTLAELETYYKNPGSFLKKYSICYYPWRFAHILSNGDVVVSWRCFSKPLGNIRKKSFMEIWNDTPLKEFRARIRNSRGNLPSCARCGFLWCSYNM